MTKIVPIVSLFILVPFSFANAQEQGSGPNPYTECGIGAALFPNTGWAAATSNVIWDLGTTAIISALSSPETCNAKKVETARLILETLPSLEKDVAIGDGEYVASLHQTMGCDIDSTNTLTAALRSAYAKVVIDNDYATKSRIGKAVDMYATVKSVDEAYPESCTVVL